MTESMQIEKLKYALDWYAEQARKMNICVIRMDQKSMMKVVRSLALDNGSIARVATKK